MSVENMMVVSTCHIDPDTADKLNNGDMLEIPSLRSVEYGWVFPAAAVEGMVMDQDEVPACFVMIAMRAKQLKCQWVLLDCDADVDDQLQKWEW